MASAWAGVGKPCRKLRKVFLDKVFSDKVFAGVDQALASACGHGCATTLARPFENRAYELPCQAGTHPCQRDRSTRNEGLVMSIHRSRAARVIEWDITSRR